LANVLVGVDRTQHRYDPFLSGSTLTQLTYRHPIYQDEQRYPIVSSDHVTAELGTGLVHIAPAHGADDFLLAMKHNLQCLNAVDLTGRLHCPSIALLHDRDALSKKDGIQAILQHLNGHVLHQYEFTHSYPYDWRTKKPVLILGSQQWFIDTLRLRDTARQHIEDNVKIFPEGAEKSFLSMIAQRPYWCISRQRCWGVPIPVFYTKDSEKTLVIDQTIIDHLIALVEKHGSIDFWWSNNDTRDLLPISMHDRADQLERGKDIFDVWFDSGSSFNTVLKGETDRERDKSDSPFIQDRIVRLICTAKGTINSTVGSYRLYFSRLPHNRKHPSAIFLCTVLSSISAIKKCRNPLATSSSQRS
jgi:isoleucyl-tRNA synthetase